MTAATPWAPVLTESGEPDQLHGLQSLDPGFDRSRVLTASVALAGSEHAEPATQPRFLRSLQDQLDSLPEVERAGMANVLPIGGDLWGMRFAVEGQPVASPEQLPRASFRVITPAYLAAMGTRIGRGRDFTWQDDADALQVVIVNRTLAARYWPDDDPIGKRLRWGAEGPDEPWLTVIGVAEDVRQWDLADVDHLVTRPRPAGVGGAHHRRDPR
jgi:putative ABC transport system permease protein